MGLVTTATRSRSATVVLVVIGGVLVAAIAAILFLGGGKTIVYPPGSPEFTAQTYIQALFDDDDHTAFELLAPELQKDCRPTELANGFMDTTGSAVFDEVRIADHEATIDLRLIGTTIAAQPFPFDRQFDSQEIDARMTLDNSSGDWRITDVAWPLYGCPRR